MSLTPKAKTVAQMSTELPITDMTVLIQVLDGAEYEQERRKSLIREVKQNGLTREMMLHAVAAADSQPAAAKALLQAAERTPRWDDAQEVSSDVMQENLDEIGPHREGFEAFMHEAGRGVKNSLIRLPLRFMHKRVHAHSSIQNAVARLYYISAVD